MEVSGSWVGTLGCRTWASGFLGLGFRVFGMA